MESLIAEAPQLQIIASDTRWQGPSPFALHLLDTARINLYQSIPSAPPTVEIRIHRITDCSLLYGEGDGAIIHTLCTEVTSRFRSVNAPSSSPTCPRVISVEGLCTFLSHLANHKGEQNTSTRPGSIEAPFSAQLFLLPELPPAQTAPSPGVTLAHVRGLVVVHGLLRSPSSWFLLILLRLKIFY